ncbi:MAG TPA: RNA polymerase sigma factor [Steroidobacteraceae bacterium]|nr:RNA polymerase sigma factor [Steroidobacteraceae bacterium]
MSPGATHEAVAAVWRIESARLIGALLRLVRSVELAEDLAQEALIAALERWPATGIPENPGAWLMTTARNRALDQLRQRKMQQRKHEQIGQDPAISPAEEPPPEEGIAQHVGDDLLRLIFIACHPVLSRDARAALTLKMLGGLTTEEIARAFLVPEATMAQRIVRAKRTLGEARVPFELPRSDELQNRLSSVLEVIYLIFNEGYAATRGEAWTRPEVCQEALRLGRILAELIGSEAEVHGLLALMELNTSRLPARVDTQGQPVLLLDQDRTRWDQLLLHRGLTALERAEMLKQPLGPYTLQAAIAACHARATVAAQTDWHRIVALYDALAELTLSPIVELNRAVAISMAFGPGAGLELLAELEDDPALKSYHLLPSVRGDMLFKLGRYAEATSEFERAAAMTQNARERTLLLRRADESRNCQSSAKRHISIVR